MAIQQELRGTITLRGSAQIVSEFFNYAVNSVLFQRGVYPQQAFESQRKYGLQVMVTADRELKSYLDAVVGQMQEWLARGVLQKMVLVLTSPDTLEVAERWTFDIITDSASADGTVVAKTEREINAEIAAIIRQITASVSFLPLLEDSCTFDLLMYTKQDLDVPEDWEDSEPRYVKDAVDVKLRSFDTKIHKVDTMVTYRKT